MPVLFSQSCPTCGRRVEIRTSLLGQIVACQHCRAEFVANPQAGLSSRYSNSASEDELMQRVERLLAQAQQPASQPPMTMPAP